MIFTANTTPPWYFASMVCPKLVRVDIGCGMETVRLDARRLELSKLDKVIRERVPSGFAVRESAHALEADA